MKAFILRLLLIFFVLSFTSMFFWQYFTHSNVPLRVRVLSDVIHNSTTSNAAASSNRRTVTEKNTIREHKTVHRNKTQKAEIQKAKQKVQKSAAASSNRRTVTEKNTIREHKTVHRNKTQKAEIQKAKQKVQKSAAASSNRRTVTEKNTIREHKTVHRNKTQKTEIQKAKQKVQKSDRAANDRHNVSQNPAKSKQGDVPLRVPPDVKQNPVNSNNTAASDQRKGIQNSAKSNDVAASDLHKVTQNSSDSKEIATVKNILANYTYNWKRQEKNFKSFRSVLNSSCNGISKALVTQENSPLGTNIIYDADGRKTMVKPALYNVFPKESPFKTAPWDSCAVVGNGGILSNSSCGKQIDSASFVIRCNLPPLSNGHEKDTGSKTSFVTANPSIIIQRYQSLVDRRRPFVEAMQLYGDALIALPAFSYAHNTALSLRALYSLEEVKSSGPQAVFFNPVYLKTLAKFWLGQGIRAKRLSSGIMMVSLALEVCNNVHLYGFWPFETHPYTYKLLNNHYYDDKAPKKVHNMPAEFETLLNLHNRGVIHLHLDKCTN